MGHTGPNRAKNGPKKNLSSPNGLKNVQNGQTIQNGSKCSHMVQYCPKWSKNLKWFKTIPYGPKWSKNGQKCFNLDPYTPR